MSTYVTQKGQVTIPKHIRDALKIKPGTAIQFTVNTEGEIVLLPVKRGRKTQVSRFEALRGRADQKWRTDELMELLRGDE